MNLGMTLSCEMSLNQGLRIELTGGWTTTIFPKAEEWLNQDGDRWRCLAFVGSKRSMEGYRSVVDYLGSQVLPGWKRDCLKFYRGEGPQAIDIITNRERKLLEAKLLLALEVAYQLWCDQRKAGWGQVVELVEQLAA